MEGTRRFAQDSPGAMDGDRETMDGGPKVTVQPLGQDALRSNKTSDFTSISAQPMLLIPDTSASRVSRKTTTDENRSSQQPTSPTKMVDRESLYKYIDWSDPARTMGSYVGVVGFLCGAHYLPLTQTALKYGATVLGVTASVEYVHRTFTPNTILARLRPTRYKTIPEPVLNGTLKDVHDLVQYLVVEAQKVVFGENLGASFVGFLSMFTLYWLVKLVSPFALMLLSVTLVYLSPLIWSPQARQLAQDAQVRATEIAQDAQVRATELGNTALESSQALVNDGKQKAAQLSNSAQETAINAKRRASELAQSGSQAGADALHQATDKATNATRAASDKATDVTRAAAEKTGMASRQNEGASRQNQGTGARDSDSKYHALGEGETTKLVPDTKSREEKQSPVSRKPVGMSQPSTSTGSFKGQSSLSNVENVPKADSSGHVAPTGPARGFQAPHVSHAGPGAATHTSSAFDSGAGHYTLRGSKDGFRSEADRTPRQNMGGPDHLPSEPAIVAEKDLSGTRGDIMDKPLHAPLASDGTGAYGKY